jgi:molecular chaperone DnaK
VRTSSTARSPHKGVNPDEVVAIGAGIQGGVLTGQVNDVLLLDVTPLTLGIETMGGVSTALIERNTTIPTKQEPDLQTAADNQPQVDIHVLQGERKMSADNKTIGRFALDGIPPAPRGMPQIEVTFDIDANGILNVSAKDLGTGKSRRSPSQASSGLSKDDIDRMVRDAEAHAADDNKRRESAETRNRADSLVFQTRKQLTELGDKVPADLKTKLEGRVNSLEAALKANDEAAMKTESEALMTELQAIGQHLYSQQGGPGAAGGPGPQAEPPPAQGGASSGGGDDGVIDADFTMKDDKK